uniref:Bm8264, isoform d n=1 Tax=Brugia malayi TaxID=6279 RepID=A0A1I9G8H8_BRUMA|nr:Bm8264, isoform d [Brugia malayi]
MNTSLPTSNATIAKNDCFHLSIAERRLRNRSLSSLLWTPPLYPGYSAKLDKSFKSNFCQQSVWKSTASEIATSSNLLPSNPVTNINCYPSSIQNVIEAPYQFKHPSQQQPAENEDISWNSSKQYTNSKESSGYGSGTSESDLENEQQSKKILQTITASSKTINNNHSFTNTAMSDNYNDIFKQQKVEFAAERATTRTPIRQQRNRQHTDFFFFFFNFLFFLEKNRRRSVPANLRNAFTDEIVRVLEINGVFQYETDAVSLYYYYCYY